ncbi:MAG: O-antigen ligase family protein, partial [Candidatus Kryptoniota bacterium]
MYEAISDYPLGKIVVIAMAIAFIVEGKKLGNKNVLNRLLIGYFIWFSISTIFAYHWGLASDFWVDFCKWVIIYFILTNSLTERRHLYIFVIVLVMLNFKLAQFVVRVWVENGFYSDPRGIYEGYGVGSGFFRNPNDMGAAFNSILGISLALIHYDSTKILSRFKIKWFHLICTALFAVAILATSSRGAIIGVLAVLLFSLLKVKRKVLFLPILIFLVSVYVSLIPSDNWKRFTEMGSDEDASGKERLNLWGAGIRMANEHPMTGVGPINFGIYNHKVYGAPSMTVQHNIFIQAVSELGYPGLLLLILMFLAIFKNQRETRKILKGMDKTGLPLIGLSHGLDLCLVGFIANGFFITVLYYPFFWMIMVISVSLRHIAEMEAGVKN